MSLKRDVFTVRKRAIGYGSRGLHNILQGLSDFVGLFSVIFDLINFDLFKNTVSRKPVQMHLKYFLRLREKKKNLRLVPLITKTLR